MAYEKFGSVTNEEVDKMRVKYRLKVVQSLEDTLMKNTLKSVGHDCVLEVADLQELVSFIRTKQQPGKEDYRCRRPSGPCFASQEWYYINYQTFYLLFKNATPWGRSEYSNDLASSIFSMLDVDQRNLLSFRSVAWFLGVVCSSDYARKLRFLYYLHLAFPPKYVSLKSQTLEESGEENAYEAETYFKQVDEERKSKEQFRFKKDETGSANSTRRDEGNNEYRLFEQRFLPSMDQESFVNLSRTIYSFFSLNSEEQVFSSLSRVCSLLFQIGEACRKLKETEFSQSVEIVNSKKEENKLTISKSVDVANLKNEEYHKHKTKRCGRESENIMDKGWSITFQQFLANIVKEERLLAFFEESCCVADEVRKLRKNIFQVDNSYSKISSSSLR